MRRYAWQSGGLTVALGAVLALGVLVFACGSSPTVRPTSTATSTPQPTPTPDPRVAEVEAAARRYVEAVETSAKTGTATAVDQLCVPGSQAEGNAGITADFSRENHYNFMSSHIDFIESSWQVDVNTNTASVSAQYSVYGHNADWPSLRPREADRESSVVKLTLDFEYQEGQWLVAHSG